MQRPGPRVVSAITCGRFLTVPQPDRYPRVPGPQVGHVGTAELPGHEDALTDHDRRLLAVAEAHGKAASLGPFPRFRTQPAVIADGGMVTEFSWNDDPGETRAVLGMLARAGGGAPACSTTTRTRDGAS